MLAEVEVEVDRDAEGETLADSFDTLGCSDFLPVGGSLGIVLGSCVGAKVGLAEKVSDGASLGDLVGNRVGLVVGLLVGFDFFIVGLGNFGFFIFLFVFIFLLIFFDILYDFGAFVGDVGRIEGFDDGFCGHSCSLRFYGKERMT